jgi:hypothetical protein
MIKKKVAKGTQIFFNCEIHGETDTGKQMPVRLMTKKKLVHGGCVHFPCKPKIDVCIEY